MKRNVDLLRRILLTFESPPNPILADPFSLLPPDVLIRHIELQEQADLLDDEADRRLTWAAHQFLDMARDDRRWDAAKADVFARTGGLCFVAIRHALQTMGANSEGGRRVRPISGT